MTDETSRTGGGKEEGEKTAWNSEAPGEAVGAAVYDHALRFLARRSHGEQELRRKLQERHNAPEAIEQALDRCRSLGYLNDPLFACDRFRYRLTQCGWGPRKAASELLTLGLASSHVTAAREAVTAEVDLLVLAGAVLRKRFAGPLAVGDRAGCQKRWHFLAQRGFDGETIGRLLADDEG